MGFAVSSWLFLQTISYCCADLDGCQVSPTLPHWSFQPSCTFPPRHHISKTLRSHPERGTTINGQTLLFTPQNWEKEVSVFILELTKWTSAPAGIFVREKRISSTVVTNVVSLRGGGGEEEEILSNPLKPPEAFTLLSMYFQNTLGVALLYWTPQWRAPGYVWFAWHLSGCKQEDVKKW